MEVSGYFGKSLVPMKVTGCYVTWKVSCFNGKHRLLWKSLVIKDSQWLVWKKLFANLMLTLTQRL
jgi:hypothetical protein